MSSFSSRRRTLIWVVVGLIIAFVMAVIADSLVAARTEYRISQRLYANSDLPNPPAVEVAGFPYVASTFTHELPSVTVTARDVDVPGWGLMSVHSSAQYVTVTSDDVFTGNIENAPARKVFYRIQLDGVSIGDKINISDLLIQNKDDISPRGGWESEAIFEGTPKGYNLPATVQVSLRVKAGEAYITATDVIEAPASESSATVTDGSELSDATRQYIMDQFTMKLDTKTLPLRGKPVRIYVSGGSVFIEAEQYYTSVSIQDLAPRTRPLPETEEPGL